MKNSTINMTAKVKIDAIGYCIPENVITNNDLELSMDTTASFILERTGIKTRRYISENETNGSLMTAAIKNACEKAGILLSEIDFIIVNTLSPDYHDPSQACLLQSLLPELVGVPALDIRAQCSGFLYGAYLAEKLLLSNAANRVLVICGEVLSRRIKGNLFDRNLAVLVGDGAAAAIISRSSDGETRGFINLQLGADGSYFDLIKTPGVNYLQAHSSEDLLFSMQGKELFAHATGILIEQAKMQLAKHFLSIADIDQVICHQPNVKMLEYIAGQLEIPSEKMVVTADKYGNMASASLPVTWGEADKKTSLSGLSLVIAFGGGSTWASCLYRH
jgi:anthraniloyl-CoA anthraniloyltransferase